ncbi:MAG: hypothetical protein SGJ02_10945 [bacterium]|nr:hypothetical protein [bacterium]
MKEKLVDIQTLLEWLGYEDVRSVRVWCKKNKIPLFDVGKRTYTVADFLDIFLEKELKLFVEANYEHPASILEAINNDDKTTFSTLVEAPVTDKVKKVFKNNKTMSKQAQDFLSQIKTA